MEKIVRDRFSFYKSYRDTYYELPVKDRAEFIETIMDIYFLERKIEDVNPSSFSLKLAFSSIKHSIYTSIKGFFDKKGIDYNTYPWQGCSKGVLSPLPTINNKQQAISKEQQTTDNDFIAVEKTELEKAIDSFKEMRIKIKKPLTENAEKLILAELNRIASSDKEKIEILNKSTMSCWQGIFPLKKEGAVENVRTNRVF